MGTHPPRRMAMRAARSTGQMAAPREGRVFGLGWKAVARRQDSWSCFGKANVSNRTAVTGRSSLWSRLEGHREEARSSGRANERGSRGNGNTNPQSVSG